MNITWHGQSFFKITTQKDKNSPIEVAIEPTSQSKNKSDIVINCNQKEKSVAVKDSKTFFISGAGEYEVGGVFVQATPYGDNKFFYLLEIEGIILCHLHNYNQEELTAKNLELISGADVLMIPIGGKDSLNSKDAVKMISQIEPKIVVPMEYKTGASKDKTEGVDEFLKTMGIKEMEETAKLSIKERDISSKEEGTEVVVLSLKA